MRYERETGLSRSEILVALEKATADLAPGSRVLLLPPDYSRLYSGAGQITAMLCALLRDRCTIDVMPALGTHEPMTAAQCEAFFEGAVPYASLLVHRFRSDVVKLGEVPASFVRDVSEGWMDQPIDVEVNRLLVSGGYDRILSIGQVVPHEIVGMANYSKNIFVGCGGASMISASHMLGVLYGTERVLGQDHTPVRQVFDYAEQHFLSALPLQYILTVTTHEEDDLHIHGLYIGRERALYEAAVALSQRLNLVRVGRPIRKAVVWLDEREFHSTWIGNKAVYRTRKAIADGGELLVLAPGVRKFGEDAENDALIRKYGYVGRERLLRLIRENADLQANLAAAAHMIQSSSDGRFSITYAAPQISQQEMESVGYGFMDYAAAVRRYAPHTLRDGWQTLPDGEEIYYVSNPATGLWTL